MKKVPLVTIEDGNHKVIGEADVDIEDGQIIVHGHVFSRENATKLFDESMTGFTVTPKDGGATVHWRKPLDTPNLLQATKDKHIELVLPVMRRRRLPDLEKIEPLMVEGGAYTAEDIPMLDRAHYALGVGPEWVVSERRAQISKLKKEQV